MANLVSKPTVTSIKDVGVKSVAGISGYAGYDMLKEKVSLGKEEEAGIAVGSVVAASAIKGTGMASSFLQLLLIGVAINAGVSTLNNYNVLPIATVQPAEEGLEGLGFDSEVEYFDPFEGEEYQTIDLSGIEDADIVNMM